jgi:hypothetical protein
MPHINDAWDVSKKAGRYYNCSAISRFVKLLYLRIVYGYMIKEPEIGVAQTRCEDNFPKQPSPNATLAASAAQKQTPISKAHGYSSLLHSTVSTSSATRPTAN